MTGLRRGFALLVMAGLVGGCGEADYSQSAAPADNPQAALDAVKNMPKMPTPKEAAKAPAAPAPEK